MLTHDVVQTEDAVLRWSNKKTLLKSVFSFYLGARLYFNLNRISTYFVNKFLTIILLSIS